MSRSMAGPCLSDELPSIVFLLLAGGAGMLSLFSSDISESSCSSGVVRPQRLLLGCLPRRPFGPCRSTIPIFRQKAQ